MAFLDDFPDSAPQLGVSSAVSRWPALSAFGSAVVAAALLAPVVRTEWLFVAGYAIGCVLVPLFAVIHRVLFQQRRKSPWFIHSTTPGRLVAAALVLGVSAGVGHTWLLATELAKQ